MAQKKDLTLVDFKDELLFILSFEEPPQAKEVNNICKSYGFIPKTKFVPNIETLPFSISSGKGFGILDTESRIKVHPGFKYFELDTSNTISMIWKKTTKTQLLNF